VDNLTCAVKLSREEKSYASLNRKTRTHCFDYCAENFRDCMTTLMMCRKQIWSNSDLKSYNDGYSYLLVIIDVLCKYVWVEPLCDKTSNSVIKSFQHVLAKREGISVYLQTDKDKEFVAHPMQKFLKENGIRFRVTCNPDIKTVIVERFNRKSECDIISRIKIFDVTSMFYRTLYTQITRVIRPWECNQR